MSSAGRLAVDAGGTRTRIALADAAGQLVRVLELGPANLQRLGAKELAQHVARGARELLAGAPARALAGGFAGCCGPAEQQLLQGTLAQALVLDRAQVAVHDDLHLAWLGALAGEPGILVLAGTGSAAFTLDAQGTPQRAGGYGWRFDDAGSGAWLGRRAVERALREHDGRAPAQGCLAAVLGRLGLAREAFLAGVRADVLAPAQVASLAPLVLAAAEAGDGGARADVLAAARELTCLARALEPHLPGSEYTLTWSGGLLRGSLYLREAWSVALAELAPRARLCSPAGSGLDGALRVLGALPAG